MKTLNVMIELPEDQTPEQLAALEKAVEAFLTTAQLKGTVVVDDLAGGG